MKTELGGKVVTGGLYEQPLDARATHRAEFHSLFGLAYNYMATSSAITK